MKRLVVCCDGTWSTARQSTPTNVRRLYEAVAGRDPDGAEQVRHYVAGVGTRPWERLLGGVFGFGLSANVQDGYAFLVEQFEPGDEIVLVGFSRGAYTARSLGGLVRSAGVLRREHADRQDEAYALYRDRDEPPDGARSVDFRARWSHETRIRAIGVFDTVGALGIPIGRFDLVRLLNRRWQFHDTALTSRVDAGFHAVAVDEERGPFVPTLWRPRPGAGAADSDPQRVEQVWFSGSHSDVGGGYDERGLSDLALLWMATRLGECGLALVPGALAVPQVAPDPLGELHRSRRGLYRLLRAVRREIGVVAPDQELAASSAVERLAADPAYAPNLQRYLARAGAQIAPVPTRPPI